MDEELIYAVSLLSLFTTDFRKYTEIEFIKKNASNWNMTCSHIFVLKKTPDETLLAMFWGKSQRNEKTIHGLYFAWLDKLAL